MINQTADGSYFLNAMFGWAMLPTREFSRRRPRLPARGLGRSRARRGDGQRHRARGPLQRQPDPIQFAQHATEQSQWRELPAQHRPFRDRRAAIRVSGIGRLGESERPRSAPGRVQDRRLVRQRHLLRPAIRQPGCASRQSRRATGSRRPITAIIRSTGPRTRWSGVPKTPNRNINLFIRPMFTTLQDRNLISFSVDGGLTMHEPFVGPRQRHFRPWLWRRSGQQRRVRLRPATSNSSSPSVYTPVRSTRDLSRGDLSDSGPALVADSARHPICRQSRRRARQPERSDAENQERAGDRPAHQHHVLTALKQAASAAPQGPASGPRLFASAHAELALQAGR